MEVKIKIACEDKRELIMHLEVLIDQIKSLKEDNFDDVELEDHNCYGDHHCRISEYENELGASNADAAKITVKQGSEIRTGAYIGKVKPGSVAQRIGLMPGDIITKLDKVIISSADDLEKVLSGMKEGAYFTVVYTRGSRTLSSEVILSSAK